MDAHAAVAAQYIGHEKVQAFLGRQFDKLSREEQALVDLVVGVHNSHDNAESMQYIIQYAKQYWSEEAIHTAITVCALFNFYNKWVDGHGVPQLTPELYELQGQRLATEGYEKK